MKLYISQPCVIYYRRAIEERQCSPFPTTSSALAILSLVFSDGNPPFIRVSWLFSFSDGARARNRIRVIERGRSRLLDRLRLAATRLARMSRRGERYESHERFRHRSEWLDRRHVCSLDGDGDGGGGDCSGVHRADAPTRREKTVLTQCNARR